MREVSAMKKSYLTCAFQQTAKKFPAQTKTLNAAFDARLSRLRRENAGASPEKQRQVMEMAFAKGNELGVPVIPDTDAESKCGKYRHLGMELAGIRRFGDNGGLYDLIKYPDPAETRRQCP